MMKSRQRRSGWRAATLFRSLLYFTFFGQEREDTIAKRYRTVDILFNLRRLLAKTTDFLFADDFALDAGFQI